MASEKSKTEIEALDTKGEFGANEIIPGLWLGNLQDATHAPSFITHIATIAARLNFKPSNESIIHGVFAVDDHPCADILSVLPNACTFIDDALLSKASPAHLDNSTSAATEITSNAVLVHCVSGVSRSSTAVIAWLMTRKHMKMEEAFGVVRNARPRANPNVGFKCSLEALEINQGDFAAASASLGRFERERVLHAIGDLRESANDFHMKIDKIEDLIGSTGGGLPNETISQSLLQLKQELNNATPGEGKTDDRVARTIRKSALQKIERLLKHGV